MYTHSCRQYVDLPANLKVQGIPGWLVISMKMHMVHRVHAYSIGYPDDPQSTQNS